MFIELSSYYYDKCLNFAQGQLDTSKYCYNSRGELRQDKIVQDICIGKLGEIAAYKYLTTRGYKASRPDFEIYKSGKKSFAPDIITECGKRVHVKSQGYESMIRYGASWLLQKSDKLIRDADDLDFILMVSLKGLSADVLGVVKVKDLIDNNLFSKPAVPRFAETKIAVYYDSLKKSGISMEAL